MKFDGERYSPEFTAANISYEHWHRYLFASEFVQGKVVLDIACGEGDGTFLLSNLAKKVIGVDVSPETIHRASSKYVKENIEFIRGTAAKLPIVGDGIFDVITSFETIEHVSVQEQEQFLQEVKRLLKPGGLFLVSTPNRLTYSDIPSYQDKFHQKEFYVDEFRQFLQGYFKNLTLLGENTFPVSYVWPINNNASHLIEHRIKLGQNGFHPTEEAKEVLHLIAVCSDVDLPAVGSFVQVDLSNQMLVEKEDKIQALQAQLAGELDANRQHGETIETLIARVSDRERVISNLKDQLSKTEQELCERTEQFENERREKESANWTLAMIYGSTAWKIIKVLWAVRLFLAPHGSRREAFARSLSEVLQGIRRPLDFLKKQGADQKKEEAAVDEALQSTEENPGVNPIYSQAYEGMLSTAANTISGEYVDLVEDDFPDQAPLKLIAFYLPQFHPIPENDVWWGKGFTEWRNVSKAVPQFIGHYQPHLPGELGFYDLRLPEVQERQVELAKKYGISGFCFYYYWFHGKRLLERPLDQFIANPAIDFPFCLCWANENWTRRWDGNENDVLIAQDHSEESDMTFIRDILPYLEHKNYIKIDGRPVLLIYRVSIMPNPQATIRRWKNYCKTVGAVEPYFIAVKAFDFEDYTGAGFDAAVEFPPPSINLDTKTRLDDKLELLNPDYKGIVYDYEELVRDWTGDPSPRVFSTVFPSWDNEPRKPGRGSTFAFASPALYQEWLTKACVRAMKNPNPDERIVFINAWNEWAEGAHLEPDRKYGYAYLQATVNVLLRCIEGSIQR